MSINFGRKQLPYLALKGAMAFPADTEIQNIESIQERETADEENLAKLPIGRRDFDSKCIFHFYTKNYFILVKHNAIPIKQFNKGSLRNSTSAAIQCTGEEAFVKFVRLIFPGAIKN